jgi:hypothetical protein
MMMSHYQYQIQDFEPPSGFTHLSQEWNGNADVLVMWQDGDLLFYRGTHSQYINNCRNMIQPATCHPVAWVYVNEFEFAQQCVVDEAIKLLNEGVTGQS